MRKTVTLITALALALTMLLNLTGCSIFDVSEDDLSDVTRADMPRTDRLPVTEGEIIAYYNELMTALKNDGAFTPETKPGILTEDSLDVYDIRLLKPSDSGEPVEDDSLKTMQKSAGKIRDRILDGLDLSVPTVQFGDMTASAKNVIAPVGADALALHAADVKHADLEIDGTHLNIFITLHGAASAIDKVYDAREPAKVIDAINKQSGEYCVVNSYHKDYVEIDPVNDPENPDNNVDAVYSRIEMVVELEKHEDGGFVSTGRVESVTYTVISDVTADLSMVGPFEALGPVICTMRMTETRKHTFDWYGSATWEPSVLEAASK